MIRLTEPAKIEFLQNKIWTTEAADDVKLEIKENGDVCVTAEETGLSRIRFSYPLPEELKDCYIYGDSWGRAVGNLTWSKEKRVMPWYCLFTDLNTTWGFGVKTRPDSLCFWTFDGDCLHITFDVRNGSREFFLHGRTLCAATLVSGEYQTPFHDAAHSFCEAMCEDPLKLDYPVYGGNDWYCNYGDNSYEKILNHAKRIAECAPDTDNRPFMVIDDGWSICRLDIYNGGPWEANSRFGDMSKLAKEIKALGVRPGIWMRPLSTMEYVEPKAVLKRWEFVSHQEGYKITPYGLWQRLDPSHEEAIKLVQRDIRKIVSWGYELIKHDFSTYEIFGWMEDSMGEDIVGEDVEFFDKSRTTAQIIKDFYKAIREAAGDDVVIIGCCTLSHLAAGYFELQRTGGDTSGYDWEVTKKIGINTLAMRMMQHEAFYKVDADCVGITTHIPWEKNRKWLDVLAKSGTPLFVSIGEDAYTDEVKADIKEAFKKACEVHAVSRPVDCIEKLIPQKWESDFGVDEYEWDE